MKNYKGDSWWRYFWKKINPRVLNGHPWIYDNEIEREEVNESENGGMVDIFHDKKFIGIGYYNSNSIIRVRVITRKKCEINKEFIKNKIEQSVKLRDEILGIDSSYRVIFGKADGFPGLIVDKFAGYLSIQINTLGIYRLKDMIISTLIEIFNPAGIFEKDDEKSAEKEGFEPIDGWIYKNGPELIKFDMNGINFLADTKGQKTGFFLDQRINGMNTVKFSNDKIVLDAFTYTGNFGLHALKGGAKFVTFMDYSARALEVMQEAAKLNGYTKDRFEVINGNSFDILRKFDDAGRKFDVTIIDPPSMAKNRSSKENAIKGYKELNLRAMKITNEGGYLSTSSCTQLVNEQEFKDVIIRAAEDTKKSLKIVFRGTQPVDHPVLMNVNETEYLKHFFVQVTSLKNI